MDVELLLLVTMASVIGSLLGMLTGAIPGIHVNTLASMMLVLYPGMESFISNLTDPSFSPIIVSSCIMSASVVHSFVDFVPSVFIGAPDPDESMSVLPGHRMLMEGNGMGAVRAAAIGSVVGASASMLLAIPIQYLMLNGLEDDVDRLTLGVLLFALSAIVINESNWNGRIWAIALMAFSGLLGLISMRGDLDSVGMLGEGTLLFPMLTGLFGLPILLSSSRSGRIPEQLDGPKDPVGMVPGAKGVMMGVLSGWFPGITATASASIASVFSKEDDPARFISLVASIGTVTSVFSIVTLSISGSGRSGTVLVIREIVGSGLEGFCSPYFLLMMLSVAIATMLGYVITIQVGRLMCKVAGGIDSSKLNKAVLVFTIALVALLTGPFGLLMLLASTFLGSMPATCGIDRIPLSGCLIVPVVLSELGLVDSMLGVF